MAKRSVARVGVQGAAKLGKFVLKPVRGDGRSAARVEESGEREDHWQEVELVLEMWDRVARSWNNDTLLRLARYARLEAETERELERRSR